MLPYGGREGCLQCVGCCHVILNVDGAILCRGEGCEDGGWDEHRGAPLHHWRAHHRDKEGQAQGEDGVMRGSDSYHGLKIPICQPRKRCAGVNRETTNVFFPQINRVYCTVSIFLLWAMDGSWQTQFLYNFYSPWLRSLQRMQDYMTIFILCRILLFNFHAECLASRLKISTKASTVHNINVNHILLI